MILLQLKIFVVDKKNCMSFLRSTPLKEIWIIFMLKYYIYKSYIDDYNLDWVFLPTVLFIRPFGSGEG